MKNRKIFCNQPLLVLATFVAMTVLGYFLIIPPRPLIHSGATTQTRDTPSQADPWANVPTFQLYLRMAGIPRLMKEYRQWFVQSYKYFYPAELAGKTLVLGFDDERSSDHVAGESLQSIWPNPKLCYLKPAEEIYHKNQRHRMFYDHFYPERCVDKEYVGYIDSDTLFSTMVTPNSLFRDGKPIVIAHLGPPNVACWAKNTEYWLGQKEAIQCMSYFPVMIKVSHIQEMRAFISKRFGMSFDDVFAHTDIKYPGCLCQFSMMCNYIWYYHRDEYIFRLHMAPDDKWDGQAGFVEGMVLPEYLRNPAEVPRIHYTPIPRISVHGRYLVDGERHVLPNGTIQKEMLRVMKEGRCYSAGFDLCPEKCKEFDRKAVFRHLYLFEWWWWTWDERCLEEQKKYYQEVHAVVKYYISKGLPFLGAKNAKEFCDNLQ